MQQFQQAIKAASKLLTSKVETRLLAVCETTGIALTIEAPSIGIALDYENPLARPSNFLQMAELPSSKLQSLSPTILSGLILATLKHWDMLENSKLSSAEQNLLLQSVAPFFLIQYFKFFCHALSTNKSAYSYLPKISLVPRMEKEPKYCTIYNSLKAHLEDCKEILYPAKDIAELDEIYEEVEEITRAKEAVKSKQIAEAILRARRTKEAQQKELLKEGRRLLKELRDSAVSEKLQTFLATIFSGDYLLTAEEATKERAATALRKYQSQAATRIAHIILDPAFKDSAESIFAHPDDVEVEEELEAVEAETKPTNSLASTLRAKLAAMNAGKHL